jgi:N-acetylmuramoyl-L-alanine amidase
MKIFILIFVILFAVINLPDPINSYQPPVLRSGGDKIDVIIIDAGHGGKDPGTTGTTGIHEKGLALSIAKKVKALIEKKYSDVKVVMTRNDDTFIELKERGRIANNNKGKLFVSIHCNAKKTEENDKSGFEIYLLDNYRVNEAIEITKEQNKKITNGNYENDFIVSSIAQSTYMKNAERFGTILNTELIKGTTLESRGIYSAGFLVLVGASMPSVLVECGYLSNARDEIYLKSEKGQNEIANSIYKAIRLYKFDYDFENAQ